MDAYKLVLKALATYQVVHLLDPLNTFAQFTCTRAQQRGESQMYALFLLILPNYDRPML